MPSSFYVVCVVIAICWFIKSKYFCFCSTKWLTQYLFLERLCLSGSVGSGQLWKAYSPGRSVYLINIHWRKAISPPIVNWSWEILVPILWFWNLFPMSNWIYFIWWCFEKHWELSLTLVLCVFFIIWAEEQNSTNLLDTTGKNGHQSHNCNNLNYRTGECRHRSRYLSHAKRALYHLS